MADEPTIEEKPRGWQDLLKSLKLQISFWRLFLFALLILAIIIGVNFAVNSYLAYRQAKNTGELNRQLEESQQNLVLLKAITSESLGRLEETKTQLVIETKKREAAEQILIEAGKNTDEKMDAYEKAKLRIVVDVKDESTTDLCARAAAFGITCLEK